MSRDLLPRQLADYPAVLRADVGKYCSSLRHAERMIAAEQTQYSTSERIVSITNAIHQVSYPRRARASRWTSRESIRLSRAAPRLTSPRLFTLVVRSRAVAERGRRTRFALFATTNAERVGARPTTEPVGARQRSVIGARPATRCTHRRPLTRETHRRPPTRA